MLIALIVYVIGFSTSHFIEIGQSSFKSYYGGLCVLCGTFLSTKDLTTCLDTVEVFNLRDREINTAWLRDYRATSILGLVFLFAAMICAGLKLFAFKGKKYVLLAATGMTFAAVVFFLTAAIVFTQNVEECFDAFGLPFGYGYSFALTIVGMCIAVIAGVFMVVDYNTGLHVADGQVADY
ncbi:unnamed protein product [Mytilus coruscus]|uniref:Uncharacterized protein n=1 Tax=Mytilus coruscus TaxID=42192 RepID=A0A6J7ZYK2_MYTCO|nr:unnamed protein product [Mytilus coruscus]